jgi:hypothetical protein
VVTDTHSVMSKLTHLHIVRHKPATTDSDDEGDGADALDDELREHKRLKQGRRLSNEQGRWSLAAVTKRVAAKMPRKKKKVGNSNSSGGSGKGSEKRTAGSSSGKELMARAKGGMSRKSLGAKDSKGKGKGKGKGK